MVADGGDVESAAAGGAGALPAARRQSAFISASVRERDSVLVFDQVCYEVNTPKHGTKRILDGISAQVTSGEVLAILGPSGAGKTTLLNVLTLSAAGGTAYGAIELNGVPLTQQKFARSCYFVPQHDRLWAFLTCREVLAYAADLTLTSSAETRLERVNALLKEMGLEGCADTKVGNQFFQGLSGGQKRRLSLAVALVSRPKVLFTDEPTSGLDAAAAASIMRFTTSLAVETNIVVIATIHQPSTNVYLGFDKVMLLSGGRCAYLGTARGAEEWFTGLGHALPTNMNPAEFMLDLLNSEFSDPENVKAIVDAWKPVEVRSATGKHVAPDTGDASMFATSYFTQVGVLLRRHGLLTLRDPTLYGARMAGFLMANTFFGIIYIQARDRVQEQVLPRMWLILWHCGVPCSLGVIVVYFANEQFFEIKKEAKNGVVRPSAYLTSDLLLQIPLMFVLGFFALGIPQYCVINFNGDNFLAMLLVWSLTLWSFETMAQLFAIMFENPLIGMLQFLNMWFAAFLFCGVMIPEDNVVWPFRAFCYLSSLRWTLPAMAYFEFKDTTFDGAVLQNEAPYFNCPDIESKLACFGRNGMQVLDSIHYNFETFTSDVDVEVNVLAVCGLALAYRIAHGFIVVKKSMYAMTPKAKLS